MKSTLTTLLLFITLHGLAQDSSFQLKDYKYRTPKYQTLVINLNFSGSINSETQSSNKASQKSFNLAPGQIVYSKIISTDNRLHETQLYSNSLLYSTNNKANGQNLTTNVQGSSFGWTRSDRFYKHGLFFFELGNTLTASFNHSKFSDTAQKETTNNLQLQNTASIGFGKGRIERVQDAQMALFILNDLAKQSLLSGPITKEKAYVFASLITSINNRRLFDFRRKRIYELTQIDSFLRSSGLVLTTDIRHFTTVNDNWSLAINPYRLSGAAWYVRIKPSANYNHGNTEVKLIATANSSYADGLFLGLEPEVGYERYVAKSLKWQHNMGVSAAYKNGRSRLQNSFYNGTLRTDGNFNMGNEVFTAKAYYGFGFFPNNRTQLSTDFSVTATRLHDRFSTYYQLQPMVVVGTTYFLGYRTYLSGNLYLTYRWDQYKLSSAYQPYDRSLATSVSVAFSHILF